MVPLNLTLSLWSKKASGMQQQLFFFSFTLKVPILSVGRFGDDRRVQEAAGWEVEIKLSGLMVDLVILILIEFPSEPSY